MRTSTPIALLSTAAAVVVLLSGCSISVGTPSDGSPSASGSRDGTPSSSRSAPAVAVPTVSVPPIDVPTTAAGDGADSSGTPSTDGAALPTSFPLPAGATTSLTRDDTANETAGTITVRDPQEAYRFWRRTLPGRGFRLGDAELVGGAGQIRFSGHGCGGESQLAFTGTDEVEFQCDAG